MKTKDTIQTDDAQVKSGGGKAGAVVGTIINVLMILAILVAFFCTYTAYVTKKGSGVPNVLGYEPFSIQTDSMKPVFEAGDLVIDRTIDDVSELKEGDIITFWTIIEGERVLNTHRIMEVVDAGSYVYFVTKGDNNTMEDALTVHQSEVVGKYWTKISSLGSVLDFLQTSKGFFCIIVLPVAAFFLYYLVNFFKVLFEYQAAKNRLKFEAEQASSSANTADTSDALDMTQEQLLKLLAKAQEAEKQEESEKVEPEQAETVKAEAEKTESEQAETVKAEAEKTESEKTETVKEDESSDKISLSKEELEAMIALAVKKAKEEE